MSKKKPEPVEAPEPAAAEPVVEPVVQTGISLAAYPRARIAIRRARTRAALIAFAAVLALSLNSGQTAFDATWRALVAGLVVNVVAWRCALVVWRHIVIAELRVAGERREQRSRELQQQRAAKQSQSPGFRAA
jgi:hypothetical protein